MKKLVALAACLIPTIAWGFDVGTTLQRDRLIGGSALAIDGGSTVYTPIDGTDVSATSVKMQVKFGATTRLRKLVCRVNTAPTSTETVILTVQTGTCGGALNDSSLACTITGAAVDAEDSDPVTIAAGECAVMKVTYSSSAVTSTPRFWIETR